MYKVTRSKRVLSQRTPTQRWALSRFQLFVYYTIFTRLNWLILLPEQDHLKAHLPHLRIAIVGAGIGGLSAAVGLKKAGFESVTIYEQSKAIQEVGAGIQIAPNLARLLNRWGVLDELRSDSVALVRNSLLRYADDTELGSSPFM